MNVGALVAAIPGFIFGTLVVYQMRSGSGDPVPDWVAWSIRLSLMIAGFVIAKILIGRAGLLGSLVSPSGGRGRLASDHSEIDSKIVSGDLEGARSALRHAIECEPESVELRVRLARLLRDRLRELEGAVRAFREAMALEADPERESVLLRELVELLDHRLGHPRRAHKELVGFIERHPGRPEPTWARSVLSRLSASAEGSPS